MIRPHVLPTQIVATWLAFNLPTPMTVAQIRDVLVSRQIMHMPEGLILDALLLLDARGMVDISGVTEPRFRVPPICRHRVAP